MILTEKQTIALDYLEDDITEELLYGGAAGGAKSALGSYWQLKRRLKYPGSRGFIGRAVFKTLKDTTLKTLFEIAKMQGLKRGNHFDLTGPHDKENANCIMFANSSMIYLRDLSDSPSDPDFDQLGSLEITDAFIDECGQISQKAKDTLKTRIRFGLNQWQLIPKILYATNPVKTWPYKEFYKPNKDQTLPEYRKFVQAFVTDNPHAPKAYILSLDRLPEGPQKQRLRFGNWEYDDDPATLILYDKIIDLFSNKFIIGQGGEKKITADIARFGKDKTTIGVWFGWHCKVYTYKGLAVTESADKIREFQNLYGISNSDTLVDEDGVGGGVVDILGCTGFINNATPMPNEVEPELDKHGKPKPENYKNLKSQCYFRLAHRVNGAEMYIEVSDETVQNDIIQELEQVKQWDMDKDGKKQIIPKDKVKELIGRSPDYSDMLMMREYFELLPQLSWVAR